MSMFLLYGHLTWALSTPAPWPVAISSLLGWTLMQRMSWVWPAQDNIESIK